MDTMLATGTGTMAGVQGITFRSDMTVELIQRIGGGSGLRDGAHCDGHADCWIDSSPRDILRNLRIEAD